MRQIHMQKTVQKREINMQKTVQNASNLYAKNNAKFAADCMAIFLIFQAFSW